MLTFVLCLQVVSSLIAASTSLMAILFPDAATAIPDGSTSGRVGGDHAIGYFWVILNCLATTGYVSCTACAVGVIVGR